MKIGEIAYNVYVTAILSATFLGLLYLASASVAAKVQDRQHNFKGAIKVEGAEAVYKGRKPYNNLLPLPWQDRNGYAKVILNGDMRAFLKYEDLTSLDAKTIVRDSAGKESKFNDEAKYDEKIREGVNELNAALGRFGSDGVTLSNIVEREIQEAIAER